MRSSVYTKRVVAFVCHNPGCTKMQLAKHLRINPYYDPSKLYYLVNTQIKLGNIVALPGRKKGTYALFTTKQYRSMIAYHLNKLHSDTDGEIIDLGLLSEYPCPTCGSREGYSNSDCPNCGAYCRPL